ncbi:GGDEF domain-containing protein [Roseibium sp.]|uniref:GGDEF domain-containing protein n=1 Tax=Roseibium sp. TaxID=1936156 RepID=UPI003A9781D4
MFLDAVTLVFAIVVVQIVAALLLLVVWQVMPHQSEENRASVLTWSVSLGFCGLGALIIALREFVPEDFSVIAGNALLLIGVGLGRVAVSTLWNMPRRFELAVLPGLVWLAFCQFPFFFENLPIRASFVQVCIIAIAVWTSALCFRHNAKQLHTAKWLGIACAAEAGYHLSFTLFFHLTGMNTLPDVYNHASGQMYLLLLLVTAVAKAILVFAVEIEKQQDIYRDQATQDPLTGIANRRAFFEGARQWIEEQQGWPKPYAVLMLDVDHFKSINDQHGHSFGDDILRLLGQVCSQELRLGSIAGRIGGEEFALFFPDITAHKATLRAERIRERFQRETELLTDGKFSVTLSGGLFTTKSNLAPLERALAIADSRLYSAKRSGRNRIVYNEILLEDARAAEIPVYREDAA